eukprot:779324-Prymnesium_polylepis.1
MQPRCLRNRVSQSRRKHGVDQRQDHHSAAALTASTERSRLGENSRHTQQFATALPVKHACPLSRVRVRGRAGARGGVESTGVKGSGTCAPRGHALVPLPFDL